MIGANLNQIFSKALKERDFNTVKDCIEKGVDIEKKIQFEFSLPNRQFQTEFNLMVPPVLYATAMGDCQSVDYIVEILKNKYINLNIVSKAFDLLNHHNDVSRKKYKENFQAEDFTFMHAAIFSGNFTLVKKGIEELGYDFFKPFITLKAHESSTERKDQIDCSLPYLAKELGYTQIWKYLIGLRLKSDSNPTSKVASQLSHAAMHDNVKMLDTLLKRKANIDGLDCESCTALERAVSASGINATAHLIRLGADINFSITQKLNFGRCTEWKVCERLDGLEDHFSLGFTLLHTAAARGSIECFKLLLQSGANLDALGFDSTDMMLHTSYFRISSSKDINRLVGKSPLQSAAENGHCDIIKIILDHQAQHNAVDVNDLSRALTRAVAMKKAPAVKLLLENGANPNFADNECRSAYQIASSSPLNKAVFDIITEELKSREDRKQAEAKAARYEERTKDLSEVEKNLLLAVSNGNLDEVEKLLEIGVNPYISKPNGKNAFQKAAKKNNLPLLTLLYEKSSVQYKSKYDFPFTCNAELIEEITLLRLARAFKIGDLREVKHIFEGSNSQQIDVSDVDTEGNTYLHRACKNNRFDIVQYFISQGADVNAINYKGETPLMVSMNEGEQAELIVRVLLTHNASVGIPDLSNKTEVMHAAEKGQGNVLNFLASYPGINVDVDAVDKAGENLFLLAMKSGSLDCIHEIIALGSNVQSTNNQGENALACLAHSESVNSQTVDYLIQTGVAVDAKNNSNETAFQIALQNKHISLCFKLMAARLLFLIANKQIECNGQDEIDSLFKIGGQINQRDAAGRRLIDVALNDGSVEICTYYETLSSTQKSYLEPSDSGCIITKDFYDYSDIVQGMPVLSQMLTVESDNNLMQAFEKQYNASSNLDVASPAINHQFNMRREGSNSAQSKKRRLPAKSRATKKQKH